MGVLAFAAIRLLRWTWRVHTVGTPPGRGSMIAFWHGDQLALTAARVDAPPTILVSRSWDGQWAAWAAGKLGYGVVRGSSSRGAVSGGLGMIRRLRAGRSVAVAADGPRGPWHRARTAATRMARRARAPLVPAAACCRRGIRLRSWDRMQIPAPFSSVYVVFGPPLRGTELQPALDAVWRQAASLAGG